MNPLFYALLLAFGVAAILSILWVAALDRAESRRLRDGAQPLPSARQLRSWRRGRLIVPAPNQRRWL